MIIQFRLNTQIPDDRKIMLDLPPETATGDV